MSVFAPKQRVTLERKIPIAPALVPLPELAAIQAIADQGDLSKAAEIRYGRIPELQRQVEDASGRLADLQSDQTMLKEDIQGSMRARPS